MTLHISFLSDKTMDPEFQLLTLFLTEQSRLLEHEIYLGVDSFGWCGGVGGHYARGENYLHLWWAQLGYWLKSNNHPFCRQTTFIFPENLIQCSSHFHARIFQSSH